MKMQDAQRWHEMEERLKYTLIFAIVLLAAGTVYLGKVKYALLFVPIAFLMELDHQKDEKKKRKFKQLEQFQVFLEEMNASMMVTDKSPEACLNDALREMEVTQEGKGEVLMALKKVQNRLKENYQCNFATEMEQLARELDNADIRSFAHSVSCCYGVNNMGISHVIKSTTNLIQEKKRIEDQIQADIAETASENRMMLCVPTAMILFLRYGMNNYMDVMYTTKLGMLLMAVVYLLNVAAYFWCKHILRRENE